jgi:hypothetical protein
MVWLQQAEPSGHPGFGNGPNRPTALRQKLGAGDMAATPGRCGAARPSGRPHRSLIGAVGMSWAIINVTWLSEARAKARTA